MGWVGGQLKGTIDLGSSNANANAIDAISGAAGLIVNAAARTLISGTDFGDNIVKALPDTIANTIGGMVERDIQEESVTDALLKQNEGMPPDLARALSEVQVTGDSSSLYAYARATGAIAPNSSPDAIIVTGSNPDGTAPTTLPNVSTAPGSNEVFVVLDAGKAYRDNSLVVFGHPMTADEFDACVTNSMLY
jgi:hypothetical protein